MNPPTWLELLVRMTAGEAEEKPFVGVLEVLGDEDPEWPSVVRVFKDRERYRVEDLDGTLLTIRNALHVFSFGAAGDHPEEVHPGDPQRFDNDGSSFHPGAYGHLLARRHPTDWRGDDFTTPTGPARPVTFLGRDAWEVELAPPDHKPSPLVLVVDVVTGMTYEQRSRQFGPLSRWTEIEDVEAHPDELFEWAGDAFWYTAGISDVADEDEAEWRREQAAMAEAVGIGPLTVSAAADPHVYELDDDGSFHLSFTFDVYGSLQRRPTSDAPWDLDQNFDHEERWSDTTWDWCVANTGTADLNAQIRRQVSQPRPDAQPGPEGS